MIDSHIDIMHDRLNLSFKKKQYYNVQAAEEKAALQNLIERVKTNIETDYKNNTFTENRETFRQEIILEQSKNQDFEELFDPSMQFIEIFICYYWDLFGHIRKGKLLLTKAELLFKCSRMPFIKLRLNLADIISVKIIRNYKNQFKSVVSINCKNDKSFCFYKFRAPKHFVKNIILRSVKNRISLVSLDDCNSYNLDSVNLKSYEYNLTKLGKKMGNVKDLFVSTQSLYLPEKLELTPTKPTENTRFETNFLRSSIDDSFKQTKHMSYSESDRKSPLLSQNVTKPPSLKLGSEAHGKFKPQEIINENMIETVEKENTRPRLVNKKTEEINIIKISHKPSPGSLFDKNSDSPSLKRPDHLELFNITVPENHKDNDTLDSSKRSSPNLYSKNLNNSDTSGQRRMSQLKRKIISNQTHLGNFIRRGSKAHLISKSPEINIIPSPDSLIDRLHTKSKKTETKQKNLVKSLNEVMSESENEVYESALSSAEDDKSSLTCSSEDEDDRLSKGSKLVQQNYSVNTVPAGFAQDFSKLEQPNSLQNMLMICLILFFSYLLMSAYNYYFISNLEIIIKDLFPALNKFYD